MTTKSAFKGMLAWTAMMLNLSACSGQPINDGTTAHTDSTAQRTDTPKVDVRVNKEYDEHGDLIAYDSTYSSVYTSRSGDAAFMDSVFKDFMPGFGMSHPFLNDPGYNGLFFPDTSFHRDFFHPDFFQKRMEMNQQYIALMEQMDSLKNQYFIRPAPSPHHRSNGGVSGGNAQGSGVQPAPQRSQRGGESEQRVRRESMEL